VDLTQGFVSSYTFYDDKNFPYGFSRSGIFSIAEAELLSQVGSRLFSLEQGIATAENQVEDNFVKVCQGEHEATTRVELLWQKYKKHTGKKSLTTLGSKPDIHNDEIEDGSDD
jgi:uncharacterized protein YifE (UPF0438 family)